MQKHSKTYSPEIHACEIICSCRYILPDTPYWTKIIACVFVLFLLWMNPLDASNNDANGNSKDIFRFKTVEVEGKNIHTLADSILLDLQEEGFLKARLDSVFHHDDEAVIFLSRGTQYFYVVNSISEINETIARPTLALRQLKDADTISFDRFKQISLDILHFYAERGYPFARIEKENVEITGNTILKDIIIDPGDEIVIDSLSITGDATIHPSFLASLTGIAPGSLYNESLITQISEKLRELEFAELTGPVQLAFSIGQTQILLPLNHIPSNRFDGMAGLSGGGDGDTPLQVAGSLNLYLSNNFAMGETIDLSWQGPGNQTQILNTEASLPYTLGLPLDTEANFSIHRQDTSWLQIRFRPALFFKLTSVSKLGVFWDYTSNDLISTGAWQNSMAAPPILDFRIHLYGLEYRYHTRGFNTMLLQRGFRLKAVASAGSRETLINSRLPEDIYADMEMHHPQFQLEWESTKRWLTGSRSTFSLSLNVATKSGKELPVNQLFMLGGFRSLRGFDELSVMASSYGFGVAEFRFFTGLNSYFNLFANGGWYEQKTSAVYFNDLPVGFGGGINLQTQAGIFSVNIALGIQRNVPFAFRNAKVHVGYISNF